MAAPFACDLTVFTAGERGVLQNLVRRVFDACASVEELPDGYRLGFSGTANGEAIAALAVAVVEWVTLERRCCPCISFAIEFPEDHGPMAVRMTGRAGIKPFLLAEFGGRIEKNCVTFGEYAGRRAARSHVSDARRVLSPLFTALASFRNRLLGRRK